MKLASTIARYLLGLMFTVFGLNGFFHFLPQPPFANPLAMQYMVVMATSHYIVAIFAFQLLAGVLLLVNRFVPLALVILAAVITNILLFHLTMDLKNIGGGIVVAILWILVFLGHRASFRPLLRAQPVPSNQ